MAKEKIDFYEYGKRMAQEFFDIQRGKAQEIEEQYGKKARFEFETGLAEMVDIRSNDFINNDDMELMFDGSDKIETLDSSNDYRNNSYFGYSGISKKCDRDGRYNDPGKGIK